MRSLALFLDAGGAVADEVMAAFRAALRGRRADVRIRAAHLALFLVARVALRPVGGVDRVEVSA